MDRDNVDLLQPLDEEEGEVARSPSLAPSLAADVAWVRVMEMVGESVIPAATVLLKVDCVDRTTLPPADSTLAQNYVVLLPAGLARWLSCNPEKASCMRQIWLLLAADSPLDSVFVDWSQAWDSQLCFLAERFRQEQRQSWREMIPSCVDLGAVVLPTTIHLQH
jgi:hypothetical protein